jgi:hypothetical protein
LENDVKQNQMLDTEALIQMFEEAEDASISSREEAERDRDYVDNKQLTSEEIAAMNKRGQPPIFINRIKRKIDTLRGHEITNRIMPRALPRTPRHEADAQGIEQALRYVAEDQFYAQTRTEVWDNILVEGFGGVMVTLVEGYNQEFEIKIEHIPWDRLFFDPHSSKRDFSDASYIGMVIWKDFDEAKLEYPEGVDALEATMQSDTSSLTYDDKPKFRVWADKKRKRVRICQIWYQKGSKWFFAEFTKGGTLKEGESPYVSDKGESECPLILGSAYIDRDNNRYGIVREMIPIQDEINKRRSKALHLLNSTQILIEDGAVKNLDNFRREMARPDGIGQINSGFFDKVKIETRTDLASGHIDLMQEAKNEIDQMAGNIALQGNALNQTAASGKAIIASQQASILDIMPVKDQLRHIDIRAYRAIYSRIRQGWTAEKWVRITDDERNIKWVGLNVDPQMVAQQIEQAPEMKGRVAGMVANVAELDCDITIEDMPDGLTPQLEQFQSLVELKKMDANNEIPFRALLLAAPNLKNKEQILQVMDEGAQKNEAQQMQMQMEVENAQSKIEETQANTMLKQAQAEKAMMEAQSIPVRNEIEAFKVSQSQQNQGFEENPPSGF